MCKKIAYLVSLVLVLAFVSNASATDTYWLNSTSDGRWDTAGNWSTLAVPTGSDAVRLTNVVPGPLIDSITNAVCLNMLGPGHSGTTTMDINGGTLTTTAGYWSIGQNPGTGNGTANVWNNATVTVNGHDLFVGNQADGTLNVGALGAGDNTYIYTSAYLRIANTTASNFGHVNLYSGTITCNDIFGIAGKMLTDIYEGTLIIRNKTGAPIQNWIDNGYIIGYGGAGTVTATVSPEGWDVLTAVPEPATIALLSLGGLALIRRKRA
jgi:hypothetical protein